MITDPAQPFFKDGLWTWDGSQWRRQPMLFGYSDLAGEDVENTNLDAGTNDLDSAAVASGYVEVVTQVAMLYSGTPGGGMRVYPIGTAGTPVVLAEYSVTSNHWYYGNCFAVLQAGDYLRMRVNAATAGDTAYFRYSGYKMSIVE